ncbi:type II toxin-antitoxin system death-on-curing family toxin [Pedobacter sp. MC2016-05]|uniref:type II toxin-antitoxin system death-on-curing family toxin n=1 Tax=Pedobacter sp. MC2016-05 TaxID=2994474 RepID=UPI003A522B07
MINHPFVDGNKRTAYTLMRLILLENGLDITASQQLKYDLVISASMGEFRFEDIRNWIQNNLKK